MPRKIAALQVYHEWKRTYSSTGKLVSYNPGDAIGSPAALPLLEAEEYLREDTQYLNDMLDSGVVSSASKWPEITFEGKTIAQGSRRK